MCQHSVCAHLITCWHQLVKTSLIEHVLKWLQRKALTQLGTMYQQTAHYIPCIPEMDHSHVFLVKHTYADHHSLSGTLLTISFHAGPPHSAAHM